MSKNDARLWLAVLAFGASVAGCGDRMSDREGSSSIAGPTRSEPRGRERRRRR